MRDAILPQVRVPAALREAAEAALAPGESLSELVEHAVRRAVELRRLDREFEARAAAALRAHADGATTFATDALLDDLRRMTAARREQLARIGPARAVHEPSPPPFVRRPAPPDAPPVPAPPDAPSATPAAAPRTRRRR